MSNMKNTSIGILAVAIFVAICYFIWVALSQSVIPTEEAPIAETKNTYATSTFSIQYPPNYILDDAYSYEKFKGKSIVGVKFVIPESFASGTNLSAQGTGVSVEMLPRAKKCTADIYILEDVKAIDLTMGSTTYSVATTSGVAVASDNFLEEQVFAVKNSSPCVAVRYSLNSTAIGDAPPAQAGEPAMREFDHSALIRAFDDIRNSLILNQ